MLTVKLDLANKLDIYKIYTIMQLINFFVPYRKIIVSICSYEIVH